MSKLEIEGIKNFDTLQTGGIKTEAPEMADPSVFEGGVGEVMPAKKKPCGCKGKWNKPLLINLAIAIVAIVGSYFFFKTPK